MNQQQLVNLISPYLSLANNYVLEPVQSGVVNRVFKLSDGESHYAVKLTSSALPPGVNLSDQFRLQRLLAQQGIAPMPVHIDEQHGIWVEQWIDSSTSLVPRQSDTDVALIARTLATIHRLPIAGKKLDLVSLWKQHLTLINEQNKTCMSQLMATFDDLQPQVEEIQSRDICLCHHDLSIGHIVQDNPLVIVDWEYAAVGNRFFDLASCVAINQLTQHQTAALCATYAKCSELPVEQVLNEVAIAMPLVRFTNELWLKSTAKLNRTHLFVN